MIFEFENFFFVFKQPTVSGDLIIFFFHSVDQHKVEENDRYTIVLGFKLW